MINNKININIIVYIILNLMVLTFVNDYLCFFVNINYLISILLSSGIIIFLNKLFLRKIKITNNFNRTDIIFFILLFLVMIISIMYPDRSFDTFNYHLYLQENPFGNKIGFDFFAGKNINSYTYAFSDRLFYIFRFFLGYRLGVLLNYLMIVAIYVQIKNIIKKLGFCNNNLVISLIALFTSTTLSLIDIVDSYYVDLVSVVLILEVFDLVIFSKLNQKDDNKYLFGYFGLLFGLCFASKISNSFILILLFVIYIIKNRNFFKCLNIKNIIVTLICFLLPFILYLTYTFVQTGNPVFPFYNTIFKSKYFGIVNWLDTRFGPKNLIETIIWPVYILFNPGRADDISIIEPIWSLGYVVSIYYLLLCLYRKIIKKEKSDSTIIYYLITTILAYIVWSKFQLGYSRYGLVVLVLGCISSYMFFVDAIKNKKNIYIGALIPVFLFNIIYIGNNYIYKYQFWIYDNYFNNPDDYKYNIQNIFASGNENRMEFEENSIWAIFYYNSGLAQMVNNKIPIVNITNSVENEYTATLLNERIDNASHIYTIVDSLDFNNFMSSINNTYYKIKNVKSVFTSRIIGNKNQFVYVFEIEKVTDSNVNNYGIFQTKEIDVSGKNNFSMFIGIAKDLNKNYNSNLPLSVIGVKDGIEYIISNLEILYDGNMLYYNCNVSDYDLVLLKSLKNDGEIDYNNWFMGINIILN